MAIIKRILLCLLLLVGVPVFAQDLTAAKLAYEMGDYARAIDLYESLRQIGIQDGVLYYNLAATYYQAGDEGKALLNALRAQQFLPRDGEVQALIAQIRGQRTIPYEETDMLALFANFTKPLCTLTELFWLSFVVWCAACLMGSMARRTQALGWQIGFGIIIVILGVLLGLLGSRWFITNTRPLAVVTTATQAMSGTGNDYLRLFAVETASEVWMIETQAEWVRVALPDGRQGWLPQITLETIAESR